MKVSELVDEFYDMSNFVWLFNNKVIFFVFFTSNYMVSSNYFNINNLHSYKVSSNYLIIIIY